MNEFTVELRNGLPAKTGNLGYSRNPMEPGQEAMKVVARSNFREMLMCKPGELRWWTFADKLEDRMSLVDATIAQRGTK